MGGTRSHWKAAARHSLMSNAAPPLPTMKNKPFAEASSRVSMAWSSPSKENSPMRTAEGAPDVAKQAQAMPLPSTPVPVGSPAKTVSSAAPSPSKTSVSVSSPLRRRVSLRRGIASTAPKRNDASPIVARSPQRVTSLSPRTVSPAPTSRVVAPRTPLSAKRKDPVVSRSYTTRAASPVPTAVAVAIPAVSTLAAPSPLISQVDSSSCALSVDSPSATLKRKPEPTLSASLSATPAPSKRIQLDPSLSPTSSRRLASRLALDSALELDALRWVCSILSLPLPTPLSQHGDLCHLLASGDTLHALLQLLPTNGHVKGFVLPPLRFPRASPGTFYARDNLATALRVLGAFVGRDSLFEVNDIDKGGVEGGRAVTRTVLAIAREMRRLGVEMAMPQAVVFEEEIELEKKEEEDKVENDEEKEEEKKEENAVKTKYIPVTDDEIDAHVAALLMESASWMIPRLTRIRRGSYYLRTANGANVKIHVRVLWQQLMVRVGGGWEDMISFCEKKR